MYRMFSQKACILGKLFKVVAKRDKKGRKLKTAGKEINEVKFLKLDN